MFWLSTRDTAPSRGNAVRRSPGGGGLGGSGGRVRVVGAPSANRLATGEPDPPDDDRASGFGRTALIAPGLGLHRRVVQSGNLWLVTLQFINQYQEVQGTSPGVPDKLAVPRDFISREEASFMQFAAKATCRTGLFEPRPQLLRGGDEDQQIAELIYRDVKEYAVGHLLARWKETEGGLSPEN